MRKILFFIMMIFAVQTGISQTTIWTEDFDSYDDYTGVRGDGSGGVEENNYPLPDDKWTIDYSDNHFENEYDYFEVYNHKLVIQDSDGTDNTDGILYWYSEEIDISSFHDVAVSMEVSNDDEDELEDTDFYRLEYSLDGGSWTTFETNGYGENDFSTPRTGSQTGLNGETLQIRIKTRTTAGGEHIYFDDIVVNGYDNSEVYDPGNQPDGDTISSLVDTDSEAVEVFKITIEDQGAGDGLPTKVTNIRLWAYDTDDVYFDKPFKIL